MLLYHHIICPLSRKVRIHLAAKGIPVQLVSVNFWEKVLPELQMLNPAKTVPVLVDEKNVVSGSSVISEYIEEENIQNSVNTRNFLGSSIEERAEIRRIQEWFGVKFYFEVSKYVISERFIKLTQARSPEIGFLRMALSNAKIHFAYLSHLLSSNQYLFSDRISVADFSAAAQISVLDYFGDINWVTIPDVRAWYSLVKSHKIFGEILRDRLSNITPPSWYEQIDF